jgi:hypothetical protein
LILLRSDTSKLTPSYDLTTKVVTANKVGTSLVVTVLGAPNFFAAAFKETNRVSVTGKATQCISTLITFGKGLIMSWAMIGSSGPLPSSSAVIFNRLGKNLLVSSPRGGWNFEAYLTQFRFSTDKLLIIATSRWQGLMTRSRRTL